MNGGWAMGIYFADLGEAAFVRLPPMTRDIAVQVAVEAMARWHDQDHGLRCTCVEGEQFGYQAAVVVDAPTAAPIPAPGARPASAALITA